MRRRRQHNVGSPGYVMRNIPRFSLNRSNDGGVALKVLVLKLSILGGRLREVRL